MASSKDKVEVEVKTGDDGCLGCSIVLATMAYTFIELLKLGWFALALGVMTLQGCSARRAEPAVGPQRPIPRHEAEEVFGSPMDELDFAYEAELLGMKAVE